MANSILLPVLTKGTSGDIISTLPMYSLQEFVHFKTNLDLVLQNFQSPDTLWQSVVSLLKTAAFCVGWPGWHVCQVWWEHGGCSESVQQDAISRFGRLECNDIGTCEVWTRAEGTGTISTNATGRFAKPNSFSFCGGVECMWEFSCNWRGQMCSWADHSKWMGFRCLCGQ